MGWKKRKFYFFSCLIKAFVTCQDFENQSYQATAPLLQLYGGMPLDICDFYSIQLSILKPCRAVICCTIKMKSATFLINSHYCLGQSDFLCKHTQHATIKIVKEQK